MTSDRLAPTIAVLGASGLIGDALVTFLERESHAVVPVARRFTPVRESAWAGRLVQAPLVDLDAASLRKILDDTRADIVVNCIGALQDAPGASAAEANRGFVVRLLEALGDRERDAPLLVHISIPGDPGKDRTGFAAAKREAEAMIAGSGLPFAILRPGFVLTDAAYGGSALMRALAILPFALPRALADRPFAVTDARDIGRTVTFLAGQWQAGRRDWRATWDVMADGRSTVGTVLDHLSTSLAGPKRRLRMPGVLLKLASLAGDAVSTLGWRPPVRATALAEMQRGVAGDPAAWRAATGLEPLSSISTPAAVAATVQERWFARLYLLKALVIGILVPFWILSGLIALTIAFDEATRILTDHGFAAPLAKAITVVSSLADIAIGLRIANRRTCATGLLAGIALSLFYMATAALITPTMWVEPLGALVKTGPAIVLMMVGLAILDDR